MVVCHQYHAIIIQKGREYSWSSSPELLSSAGYAIHSNLVFASGILCSGNGFVKIKRMMEFMGVKCISQATYYRYIYIDSSLLIMYF